MAVTVCEKDSPPFPCSAAGIRHLILRMGATPRYVGFEYMIYAIQLALENSEYLLSITKELYPDVARHFNATIGSVERNIRTVIAAIWNRNPALLHKIAGYPLSKKPTVGEFISIVREYLYSQADSGR